MSLKLFYHAFAPIYNIGGRWGRRRANNLLSNSSFEITVDFELEMISLDRKCPMLQPII